MISITHDIAELVPIESESPSEYADRLGIYYTALASDEHKKKNGQFFTPLPIARFMASYSICKKKRLKILDPGCGVGVLTAALCEEISLKRNIKWIELTAFETDISILPFADLVLKYLSKWLKAKNIEFTYFLCKNDFVLHNSTILLDKSEVKENYDLIISNPPYFKLQKDDDRIVASQSVIYGQTNIYSIFLLIASKLLSNDGQLIFITPRSFCSGSYFRLFREIFFNVVEFQNIHLFKSRRATFKRDKILQENIIITAKPISSNLSGNRLRLREQNITISTSTGIEDLESRMCKVYGWEDLVNMNSYQKNLHLPTSEVDEKVIEIFKKWTGSLSHYQFNISTGPVVDFRSLDFIFNKKKKGTVPIFWLHNVLSMNVSWPKNSSSNGKSKGQYIMQNEESLTRLVANKNYVFIRRFSTKDDTRRLIAAPYLKVQYDEFPMIGIENHLNYIYHTKRELSLEETYGISAILNSRLFDIYFRTFNGNINVSATELRNFPLPDIKKIRKLGREILNSKENNVSYDIDSLVYKIFNLSFDTFKNYGY